MYVTMLSLYVCMRVTRTRTLPPVSSLLRSHYLNADHWQIAPPRRGRDDASEPVTEHDMDADEGQHEDAPQLDERGRKKMPPIETEMEPWFLYQVRDMSCMGGQVHMRMCMLVKNWMRGRGVGNRAQCAYVREGLAHSCRG